MGRKADLELFRAELARRTNNGADVAEYLVETMSAAADKGGTPVGNEAAKTILAYMLGKPVETHRILDEKAEVSKEEIATAQHVVGLLGPHLATAKAQATGPAPLSNRLANIEPVTEADPVGSSG